MYICVCMWFLFRRGARRGVAERRGVAQSGCRGSVAERRAESGTYSGHIEETKEEVCITLFVFFFNMMTTSTPNEIENYQW